MAGVAVAGRGGVGEPAEGEAGVGGAGAGVAVAGRGGVGEAAGGEVGVGGAGETFVSIPLFA